MFVSASTFSATKGILGLNWGFRGIPTPKPLKFCKIDPRKLKPLQIHQKKYFENFHPGGGTLDTPKKSQKMTFCFQKRVFTDQTMQKLQKVWPKTGGDTLCNYPGAPGGPGGPRGNCFFEIPKIMFSCFRTKTALKTILFVIISPVQVEKDDSQKKLNQDGSKCVKMP